MADFTIGDKAVYPGHGVTEVTGLEKKEFSGQSMMFYVLRVLENDMTVMVPERNAVSVGLRNIVNDEEIARVYEVLAKRNVKISTATWNRRYREYMEKIKTGSLQEIATVFRDLSLLRSDKDLSFGERKMLETAKGLLVQELALARTGGDETKTDPDSVATELEQMFAPTAAT